MNEERVSTGIPGLDDVLCGGFDPERLYLVEGARHRKDHACAALGSARHGWASGMRLRYPFRLSISTTRVPGQTFPSSSLPVVPPRRLPMPKAPPTREPWQCFDAGAAADVSPRLLPTGN